MKPIHHGTWLAVASQLFLSSVAVADNDDLSASDVQHIQLASCLQAIAVPPSHSKLSLVDGGVNDRLEGSVARASVSPRAGVEARYEFDYKIEGLSDGPQAVKVEHKDGITRIRLPRHFVVYDAVKQEMMLRVGLSNETGKPVTVKTPDGSETFAAGEGYQLEKTIPFSALQPPEKAVADAVRACYVKVLGLS